MALTKSKKKEILEKVSGVAEKANSVVFVNFHGLTVADSTAMRKQLRNAGVKYTVAKKTLVRKAFGEKKIEGTMPELEGELALAYLSACLPAGTADKTGGEDLIAPAREVFSFEKKHEGKVSILGGIFEKRFMTKEEMTNIASIPSRDTLLGMFVNLINSPIQRLAIVMSEIVKTKTN